MSVFRDMAAAHAKGASCDDVALAASFRLTSRERQVVVLVAEGLHDKEIAARLGLSPGSVRTYLRRAYARNHIGGRVELVVAWLKVVMPESETVRPRSRSRL